MKQIVIAILFIIGHGVVLAQQVERNPTRGVKSNHTVEYQEKSSADTVLINYQIVGDSHLLIFTDHLPIPRENYPRHNERMQYLYPVIEKIEFFEVETDAFFVVTFLNTLPEHEKLNEILSKFALKHYRIIPT